MTRNRPLPATALSIVSTALYWVIAIALIIWHVYLCHPSVVSRGRLEADEIFALFWAPALIGLPAISGAVHQRRIGLLVMTFAFSLTYALVRDNLGAARPHPGNHLGMFGLVQSDWRIVLIQGVFMYPFLLVPLYFVERVGGDICSIFVRNSGPTHLKSSAPLQPTA